MFGENLRRKYALTEQGLKNTKKGALWTVIVNLTVMCGIGILYLLMTAFMDTLNDGVPLPGAGMFISLTVIFVILSLVTHVQQYRTTYGLVYNEVRTTRLTLAERLRRLPAYGPHRRRTHRPGAAPAPPSCPSAGQREPPQPGCSCSRAETLRGPDHHIETSLIFTSFDFFPMRPKPPVSRIAQTPGFEKAQRRFILNKL